MVMSLFIRNVCHLEFLTALAMNDEVKFNSVVLINVNPRLSHIIFSLLVRCGYLRHSGQHKKWRKANCAIFHNLFIILIKKSRGKKEKRKILL